nr:tRNA pseudouridine(55) synthase [Chitinophagales bacterium]
MSYNFSKEELSLGAVIPINKPLTWTSFNVVKKVNFALKKANIVTKIGHAGTLDPLATGLLILCTGKKTKTIESIQIQPKTYIATIYLGAIRPSYDKETEIT